MRRVRNQNTHANNPALMFARGVESMVGDHLYHPGKNDEQEMREQQRLAHKMESRGNLFSVLLRQFANY
jgi:hypothetical protein